LSARIIPASRFAVWSASSRSDGASAGNAISLWIAAAQMRYRLIRSANPACRLLLFRRQSQLPRHTFEEGGELELERDVEREGH
jgi:hypothetical protein